MFMLILTISILIIASFYLLTEKFPQQWTAIRNFCNLYIIGTAIYLGFIVIDKLYSCHNKLENPQERDGHIAIVTGGGRGLGVEIVKGLMKNGMTVVMAVRHPETCEVLLNDMKKECSKGNVLAMKLDLSSMNSVREFVDKFSAKFSKLHILVNNAGIFYGDYKITEDGFEEGLATNYLGHFLLTHLLMEMMKATGRDDELYSRIVNVSSCAHINGKIHWDDINLKDYYNFGIAYSQSKLAQIMFSHRLDKSFNFYDIPVRSYAVNPGVVDSDMLKSILSIVGSWAQCLNFLARSPTEGAVSVLFACLSPTLERHGGKYITNCLDGCTNAQSKSSMDQDRLFKQTMSMLNITQFGTLVGYFTMAIPGIKTPNKS